LPCTSTSEDSAFANRASAWRTFAMLPPPACAFCCVLPKPRPVHNDVVFRKLHALAMALDVEICFAGVEAREFGTLRDAIGGRLHARGLAFDLAVSERSVRRLAGST